MKLVWGRSIGFNIELAKMKVTQIITNGCDCYPWTSCYAWLPVRTITGKPVWGQKLFKRKVWIVWGSSFHMEPEIQYATALDILADPYKDITV